MDKIETPEEFAQSIEKAIVHQYQQSPNGRGGLMIISKDYILASKLITARDALIRADERQKAAERVLEWLERRESAESITKGFVDFWGASLRAAIMAEPEEGRIK